MGTPRNDMQREFSHRLFSPAAESGRSLGASAPEATRLQGLKAPRVRLREAAGLKPRPSKVPCYEGVFRHRVLTCAPGNTTPRAPEKPIPVLLTLRCAFSNSILFSKQR